MTKLLMMLLLTISFASCRSVERKMICSEINKFAIKPVQMCDWNEKFDRCRCRMMDFNSWTNLSEAENFPRSHCDKLAGFHINVVAEEIKPKIKAVSRLKENLCQ